MIALLEEVEEQANRNALNAFPMLLDIAQACRIQLDERTKQEMDSKQIAPNSPLPAQGHPVDQQWSEL